ncbi:hypothetical protein [Dyadobacter fanqingshengii]|uniref:Uncharacterized protein n=1 Tax=Dyadobacter fanqingshengii TaxID=2906443 RepID=A0A9X1PFG7_9BACT|nr:hypothetical protein [Dyadobacter fanqingshengii]MCF0043510.1 hypothetical protein [Dyadobacter fanqingshengii]USJ34871.1 hypothetical protein NFI81_19430 [Dyadobacter fanqingshengii]
MVRSVTALFVSFLCTILFQTQGFGQKIKPLGLFLTDSIEVGKPVYFSLSVRHNPKTEIFFPDTLYDFSPFEIISKRAFASSTDNRGSLDSAVYQLISFDVSDAQALKMPVYVFHKKDCTAVFTKPDSVFLIKSNVVEKVKTASLKPETSLLPLSSEFNFSILLGSIALIIGVVGSIYWVFGQDIYKQWQLIKLQRRHLEYIRSFNRLMRNARDRNNIKDAEKAIIVWKNYLERLEKKPFATYTTREIMDNMPDEALAEALKNMDSIIYGQVISKNMAESLEVLKSGATRIYRNKRRFILDTPMS